MAENEPFLPPAIRLNDPDYERKLKEWNDRCRRDEELRRLRELRRGARE